MGLPGGPFHLWKACYLERDCSLIGALKGAECCKMGLASAGRTAGSLWVGRLPGYLGVLDLLHGLYGNVGLGTD